MPNFSERYGYVVKPLQLESMTIELRNRIWNIYRCEICNDIAVIDSHYLEEIMDSKERIIGGDHHAQLHIRR